MENGTIINIAIMIIAFNLVFVNISINPILYQNFIGVLIYTAEANFTSYTTVRSSVKRALVSGFATRLGGFGVLFSARPFRDSLCSVSQELVTQLPSGASDQGALC